MQKSVLLLKKYAKTLFAIWLKEKPTANRYSILNPPASRQRHDFTFEFFDL